MVNRDHLGQHILGGLVNALIGDAMGSATESMTAEDMQKKFGGMVSTFYKPEEGTFAYGRKAGQITDDTSQMIQILQDVIKNKGKLTVELVVESLLAWAEDEELFASFAGPTTRKAILKLREGENPFKTGIPEKMGMGISNGAAMKIAPAGFLHPGDVDAAVRDAAIMCVPTHNADIAYAGAGAVAAAVAEGITEHATLLSVIDAALYGSEKGYEIGKQESIVLCAPSMTARIRQAVELAVTGTAFIGTCRLLVERIGCGLPLLEAVPFAFGVFVAARGEPNLTVRGAVNMGGDADTTGTIAGAIAGSFAGIDQIDAGLYQTILDANDIDLDGLVDGLLNVI